MALLSVKQRKSRRKMPGTRFFTRKKSGLVFYLLIFLVVRSAGGTGCEKEGPCEADQFCSKSRSVCRPCADIAEFCDNRTIILQRFPTCDAFCYKQMFDRVTTELQAAIALVKNQTDIIRQQNETIISLTQASGKHLDALHCGLIFLCCVFLPWAVVSTLLLIKTKMRLRGAPPSRPSSDAHIPVEMAELLQTDQTDPSIEPSSRASEDGYGTGHSGNSSPLTARVATPCSGAEDPPTTIQQRPHVVTVSGQNVHSPTTDDKGPPEIAV